MIKKKTDASLSQVKRNKAKVDKILLKHKQKVPILAVISRKNQYFIFVIDKNQSFIEFRQTLTAKLQYEKTLATNGFFFLVKNGKDHSDVIITDASQQMGKIFEQYKTEIGWLQISIIESSIF